MKNRNKGGRVLLVCAECDNHLVEVMLAFNEMIIVCVECGMVIARFGPRIEEPVVN